MALFIIPTLLVPKSIVFGGCCQPPNSDVERLANDSAGLQVADRLVGPSKRETSRVAVSHHRMAVPRAAARRRCSKMKHTVREDRDTWIRLPQSW